MHKLICGNGVHALVLLSAALALEAPAQIFTTLVNFNGPNGSKPSGRLVQRLDGNFYGITAQGGAYSCPPQAGCGTIFRVTRDGMLTTLLSFNADDGEAPYGGLTLGTDGNLYGTTTSGRYQSLYGSIFKITPAGELTTLYGFSNSVSGTYPSMPLVEAANGAFYGSTLSTIFVITPGGSFTNLVGFAPDYGDCDSLLQTPGGDFYGTTGQGGTGNNRIGSFFKMTPKGTLTTLYSFGATGGNGPVGIVQAPDGIFFGTTSYGPGAGVGYGTVFKITPDGHLTSLHTFNAAEGYRPGGLVLASDGNFYGTTTLGGVNGLGSIYRITPRGALTTLHTFSNSDGGASPSATLFQATDGKLYGATSSYYLDGTLFSLSVGLPPFVKTIPHSGMSGAAITILGTDLAGATSVTFNGTTAKFTIISPTEIQTAVPAGATAGWIQVLTPAGALFSSGPFLVRP